MPRVSFLTIGIVFLVAGGAVLAGRLGLEAKAAVSEVLIDRALDRRLRDGHVHRPWPWADLYPVARLEVPRLGVRTAVLSGATGATLAFGLGHVDGTSEPGSMGNCALAGHRDRKAAFLEALRPDDEVLLRTARGTRSYRVAATAIVDRSRSDLLEPGPDDTLTLVTCWPFGGLTRSPWRFVVLCQGGLGIVGKPAQDLAGKELAAAPRAEAQRSAQSLARTGHTTVSPTIPRPL